MFQRAYDALQSGNFDQAEALSRHLLIDAPDNEGALMLLALSLEAQKRQIEAAEVFEKLALVYPNSAANWINLGSIRRALGQASAAADAYARALELDPADANALFNIGLMAMDKGEFQRAAERLMQAHEQAPDDAMIRAEGAGAEFAAGHPVAAERLLHGWSEWCEGDALSLAHVGLTYARLGQSEEAEGALDAAAALMPRHPKVQIRRASFFERVNRLDEARAMLAQLDPAAITREGLAEDSKVASAQIAARGEDIDLAIRLHEELVANADVARRTPELMPAIGRLYDRKGDAQRAMSWFERAHALQIEELRERSPSWFEPGADPLDITRFRVDASARADWIPVDAPDAASSPIFVLGFPRSGTTMLETMLDAHPDLVGMDERAFLHNVVEEIRLAGMTYPEDIGRMDDAMCARLRAVYWDLVYTRAHVEPGKRLVDKNPLNILRLPLIARLFPHAKIVLALRHPCDVVLSNFMQTFRTPAYIAITATIDSTARGYADTFDFWIDQAAVLKPDALEVRYEDVVEDIETASRRLADFLEVPWTQAMVDFHVRAKERGYISTPSYHQVVEPLNRKGLARWERYRQFLEPAVPHLQRFLDRWGYQA